jgi:hypothetical protein
MIAHDLCILQIQWTTLEVFTISIPTILICSHITLQVVGELNML